MDGIIPELRYSDKQKLIGRMRRCRDAGLRLRYLIIVNLASGRSPTQAAAAVQVARSTVYRVAERFREGGEAGLLDRREDNGSTKLTEAYLQRLHEVVVQNPDVFGWSRPTWTREMLAITVRRLTGVDVHVATLSRALRAMGARRGRPRPRVGCPWSVPRKNRRIRALRALLASLPTGHVAVYEDEVDIHLNPKIGPDWMVRGQQKEVLTPGNNQKRYLAGALDAHAGRVTYVEGPRKNSDLFVSLLERLARVYRDAKVIHVILDNFRIHDSRITRTALGQFEGRIVLHFLPPYCPDENRIERLWLDLHASVTRNHRCASMSELMQQVHRFMVKRQRAATRRYLRSAA